MSELNSTETMTLTIAGRMYRLVPMNPETTPAMRERVVRAFSAAVEERFASGARWTVTDLAQAAQEKATTIRKRLRSGAIKAARSRPYLINPTEVRRYLEEGARA